MSLSDDLGVEAVAVYPNQGIIYAIGHQADDFEQDKIDGLEIVDDPWIALS